MGVPSLTSPGATPDLCSDHTVNRCLVSAPLSTCPLYLSLMRKTPLSTCLREGEGKCDGGYLKERGSVFTFVAHPFSSFFFYSSFIFTYNVAVYISFNSFLSLVSLPFRLLSPLPPSLFVRVSLLRCCWSTALKHLGEQIRKGDCREGSKEEGSKEETGEKDVAMSEGSEIW